MNDYSACTYFNNQFDKNATKPPELKSEKRLNCSSSIWRNIVNTEYNELFQIRDKND